MTVSAPASCTYRTGWKRVVKIGVYDSGDFKQGEVSQGRGTAVDESHAEGEEGFKNRGSEGGTTIIIHYLKIVWEKTFLILKGS